MTVIQFPSPPEPAPAGPQPGGYAPPPCPLGPVDTPSGTAYTLVDGVAQSAHPEPAIRQRATDLPPVIATWLRSSEGRRNAAREAYRRTRYRAGFHGLRLPIYLLRIARRSPWGLMAALGTLGRWIIDREGTESIRALRAGGISGNLQSLEDTHRAAVKFRVLGALAAAVILPIGWFLALATFAAAWSPALWLWGAGTPVATVLGLGWIGRHPDKRIIERVIFAGAEVPKLTQDLVLHALASARIAGFAAPYKTHGARCLGWQKPPTRTRNGYECVVDLPSGVTVEDVAKQLVPLASGLNRSESTVFPNSLPEEKGGYAGRLHLVVTDRPMRLTPMPDWPLADPDVTYSVYDPMPKGVDYLGDPVTIKLMFRSSITGAIPNMGKTFDLRRDLTAVALDPITEIHIYDLKGGPDFLPFALGDTAVAHAFRSGSSPDDEKAMLADLHGLKKNMEDRYTTVRDLTINHPELIPGGVITRELAADKRYGLHPAFFVIDETQVCFGDWPSRKEFIALVTDLAKRGRQVGIMVWLATQSVDATTIPRSVSLMAGRRFCMKVADDTATNQILGPGAYGRGYQPDKLSLDDQGIGYLAGEGDATRMVRGYLVTTDPHATNGVQLAPILQRARKLREAANRLTGIAAGEVEDVDTDFGGIVDHCIEIWPLGQPKVHADVLAARLAEQWPTMYDGWGPNELAAALGPSGIRSKQMNLMTPEGRKNRQGYELAQFGEYLEQRDAEVDPDDDLAEEEY